MKNKSHYSNAAQANAYRLKQATELTESLEGITDDGDSVPAYVSMNLDAAPGDRRYIKNPLL